MIAFSDLAHKQTGLKLIASIWFLFCAQACVIPHLTRFYDIDLNLDDWQIGVLMAVPALGSMLAQPVWGVLSDRYLGRTFTYRLVLILLSIFIVVFSLSYEMGGFPFLLVMAFITISTYGATSPLSSALILSFLGKTNRHLFGRIRVWGSLSFMLTMFLVSPWLVRWSLSEGHAGRLYVFFAASVFYLIAASFTSWDDLQFQKQERPALRSFYRLFQNPRLLLLYLCTYLCAVGASAGIQYIGPYVDHRGFSELYYSSLWFIGVGVEVLLTFNLHYLVRYIGLKYTIFFGFLSEGMRWLGISYFTDPLIIQFFFALHGPSVLGMFFASAMYIDYECDESVRSTAQTLLYFTIITGQVTGYLGGSFLVSHYDQYLSRELAIQSSFFWFSLTGLMASLLFLLGIPHKDTEPDSE